MIEIAGVSLALGGSRILDNVSLTVPKGGVTALVGPNGAGKSSLLSLIARLQPLQSGRITVDGLPVDTTPSRQLAKIMAILRQDPGVAGRLRVVDLVGFGRFPHHRGRLTAGDREIIAASLEQFDLSDLALRFIDTLSGGQRQRALVAMTFCQGTDYILLDEPLNNLDMFHARNLMRTLRRIADEHGKTVLIVLHDINHAASYADRVVAMKDGAVVAMGETGDVIRPDILESIFGFSMRVENIAGRLTVLHHA
ncbi:ATP-binding cassette domain-containing protein [Mesorhizobium sp. M5C.F.Ca.IN.020.29.1.1]|uniref:iron ABC transporter ATP-binding protein n=1 Tax=unclassified Mesorhizobium TaxID=325217 RepID=UPI000FCA8871|nr:MULTISPECIES: ATP-binding cassette domain-containing protein [unclassified Mesorhizobium]RUV64467.1 ATP-binding cassette domain-containing protein [Mesorhizobium sp. M5C.F.Ca.IN.020.29.1.1]TIM88880.1 MAG: ATP-binding cassette domain-containing protein [Mesorhizobium sp.]